MKVIDRLKEGFYKSDYYISVYPNHIYIINYKDIIDFSSSIVKLKFSDFMICIKGMNFKIIRKTNSEIDIKGLFSSVELLNE